MLEPATQKTPRARSVDYAQLNGTVTRAKPGEARALASKAMALLQSGKVATQSEACRMVGVSPARLSTLKVETLPAYSGFNAAPSTSVELRFARGRRPAVPLSPLLLLLHLHLGEDGAQEAMRETVS